MLYILYLVLEGSLLWSPCFLLPSSLGEQHRRSSLVERGGVRIRDGSTINLMSPSPF